MNAWMMDGVYGYVLDIYTIKVVYKDVCILCVLLCFLNCYEEGI